MPNFLTSTIATTACRRPDTDADCSSTRSADSTHVGDGCQLPGFVTCAWYPGGRADRVKSSCGSGNVERPCR